METTATCPQHALNIQLELHKSSSINDFLKRASVKAFILHLIWIRKIFPCPPNDVLNEYKRSIIYNNDNVNERGNDDGDGDCNYENENSVDNYINGTNHTHRRTNQETQHQGRSSYKRKRSEMAFHRKLIKSGEQLHDLFHSIDIIFGTDEREGGKDAIKEKQTLNKGADTAAVAKKKDSGVKAVLITIGPSFNSPREQYIIRFHSWSSNTEESILSQSKSSVTDDDSTSFKTQTIPPKSVLQRLEKEISRRVVREFIQGSLQNGYCKMFETRGGGNSSINSSNSSSLKINVACLLKEESVQDLFHNMMNSMSSTTAAISEFGHCDAETEGGVAGKNLAESTSASPNQRDQGNINHGQMHVYQNSIYSYSPLQMQRFTMERNFSIKIPRMISKKKEIHRPFVVMDIIPMMMKKQNPSSSSTGDDGTSEKNCSMEMQPNFVKEVNDSWISLRSTVKGFARK